VYPTGPILPNLNRACT